MSGPQHPQQQGVGNVNVQQQQQQQHIVNPNHNEMNQATTLELLQTALGHVRLLRGSVAGIFEAVATYADGPQQGPGAGGAKEVIPLSQEEKDRAFRTEFNSRLHRVIANVREIDRCLSNLNAPLNQVSLGITSLINQEVSDDKIPLYSQLIDSYKWLEKIHEYGQIATPMLGQNPLKRTYFSASLSAKRRKTITSTYMVQPGLVDQTVTHISNSYKDMEINISRPLGQNAALSVLLGKTLRGVVILKGWLIEWVVIRGISEEMSKDDKVLDLWSESRYKVFQKVTDNANAAMLHYCVPAHPELSVRSFMTWLHSYITLFSQPCKKCGLHLSNNLPPTWRDLRSLEAFHEECKP